MPPADNRKGATMALIKIESGRVVRHVGTRGSFAVEEYKTLPDGRTFPIQYTVWHDGYPTVEIDGIVQVLGELSVKISEPNAAGKVYANISVNNPTVTAIGVEALKNVPGIKEIIEEPAKVTTEEVPF
jgi:hypothetical protein